jgi:trehalose 6-phosphate phosphatase
MPSLPPVPSTDSCLFLDVDGTLIELSDTPFDTLASDELKTLLKTVFERLGGAVALVSGRSIEYLDALFSPLHLPAAGLHGVERRSSGDPVRGLNFSDPQLDAARTLLSDLVRAHPGTLLEDKGRTLGVHYRMAPQFEPMVREAVDGVVATLGGRFHVQAGDMMLEIKPGGFTKGHAIEAFLRESPFAGRKPVFAGDDLTDLDGFRAVESAGGYSIGVGERVHGTFQLANPTQVRAWLQRLATQTD